MNAPLDWRQVPGLQWHEEGYADLHADLLARRGRLDAGFVAWAAADGAAEQGFAALIPVAAMHRARFLQAFPQLAVFPATLGADPVRLREFAALSATHASVGLRDAPPTGSMLPPAACFHVYAQLQDSRLSRAHLATTCCTCHRNEASYAWLRRQRAFSMREIVCVGTATEVRAFLDRGHARVDAFARELGLDVAWEAATDPFFEPHSNPRHLAQVLDPLKHELRLQGEVALCSVNFHRNFFGEGFGIERDGEPAYSGCIAFGLERWLYAFIARFGPDSRAWPELAPR